MTKVLKKKGVKVKRIDASQLLEAYLIREKVFVEEQKVPKEDEIDSFETTCHHYLAFDAEGKAVATARWRRTENGIKLERFAVLKEYRGQGIGSKLVEAVLADVNSERISENEPVYLHAQLEAVHLYEKFNFKKLGSKFDECGIMHYKMVLKG